MPCSILDYNSSADWKYFQDWLFQRFEKDQSVDRKVRDIIFNVQEMGDQALLQYTRQFDCPDFDSSWIKVDPSRLQQAADSLKQDEKSVIREAIQNIHDFHKRQLEDSWISTRDKGLVAGQLVKPVSSAGLYVPGGKSGETPLVSSLIMNAVPALVAGVDNINVVTPPGKDGNINPYTLATAHFLGLENFYAVGGAWAVAALAYGTETIPGVDMISGPGNIFVTTAKKIVSEFVGIDMLAGPSEILVLADNTANPDWIAADLLSQAEHDELASALLITPEKDLIEQVKYCLNKQLEELPRKETAKRSLEDWGGLIRVPGLSTGIDLVNKVAPEHLELALSDPWSHLNSVQNAGAIFLGHFCPESIGDYFAGPNHILPTLSTARFSSALGVQDFCKKSSFIYSNSEYIQKQGDKIAKLARLEGLEAHARSTLKRKE